MIKRLALLTAVLTLASCQSISRHFDKVRHGANPYQEAPFYSRYLTPDSPLDVRIATVVSQLKTNPNSATLHNELGALLLERRFPNDAELEFQRATYIDNDFYPAWYNLGLLREAKGDNGGAITALRRTLKARPGHGAARFHLGLLYENQGRNEAAIEQYVKAFAIDHALLDVRTNPRILDSKLIHRALLQMYGSEHAQEAIVFQPPPAGYTDQESPSHQPTADEIVAPSSPITSQAVQPPPVANPAPPPLPAAQPTPTPHQ